MRQQDALRGSGRSARERDDGDVLRPNVQIAKRRQRRQVSIVGRRHRRRRVEPDAAGTVDADQEDRRNCRNLQRPRIVCACARVCVCVCVSSSVNDSRTFNLILFKFNSRNSVTRRLHIKTVTFVTSPPCDQRYYTVPFHRRNYTTVAYVAIFSKSMAFGTVYFYRQ